jgi:hypothetical protein
VEWRDAFQSLPDESGRTKPDGAALQPTGSGVPRRKEGIPPIRWGKKWIKITIKIRL